MRVLVTGGAGFIGSHLCAALVADKHDVFVLDNLSTGDVHNLPAGVTLFERSITADLDDVFAKAKPAVVFHLAAQVNVQKSIAKPLADAQENIIGSLNLFEAMRTHGCKRVLFASSVAVYGDTDALPIVESESLRPQSPYGIAKAAVEQYLDVYAKAHGFSVCVLRFANVYGPRQGVVGEGGVVSVFTDALVRGEQPTIFGDGEQTRDFIFVSDVVDANIVAMHKELVGTFNVGTGLETSVNELFSTVARHTKFAWKAKHAPRKHGDIVRSVVSPKRLSAHWGAKYDLDRGVAETVSWCKER